VICGAGSDKSSAADWTCMDQNAVSGKSGKPCLSAAVKLHLTCDVGSQNLLIFSYPKVRIIFYVFRGIISL